MRYTVYLISGSAGLPAVFPRVPWPFLSILLIDGGAVEQHILVSAL